MTAKIIPIGAYQRIQDVRMPRTMKEAYGREVEVEKSECGKIITVRFIAPFVNFLLRFVDPKVA